MVTTVRHRTVSDRLWGISESSHGLRSRSPIWRDSGSSFSFRARDGSRCFSTASERTPPLASTASNRLMRCCRGRSRNAPMPRTQIPEQRCHPERKPRPSCRPFVETDRRDRDPWPMTSRTSTLPRRTARSTTDYLWTYGSDGSESQVWLALIVTSSFAAPRFAAEN